MSRDTARYLVELETPLYDHVDAYLFSHERSALARSLRTYQIYPALAIQDKYHSAEPQFASNIELESDKAVQPDRDVVSAILKTVRGYRRIRFEE